MFGEKISPKTTSKRLVNWKNKFKKTFKVVLIRASNSSESWTDATSPTEMFQPSPELRNRVSGLPISYPILCLCGAAELGAYLSWTQHGKSKKPLKMHQNSDHTEQRKVSSERFCTHPVIPAYAGSALGWARAFGLCCPEGVISHSSASAWQGEAVLGALHRLHPHLCRVFSSGWWSCLTHYSRAPIKASIRQNLKNYCLPSFLVNSW